MESKVLTLNILELKLTYQEIFWLNEILKASNDNHFNYLTEYHCQNKRGLLDALEPILGTIR